jgi:hypothetical protein
VTIEAKPGSFGGTDREGFIARANELGWSPEKLTEHMAKLDETGAFEPTIIQIKGKGNKKPNDEYLPFVQDFVKSGKWSHVGDIRNTGLVRAMDVPAKERHLFPQDKPFITEQEMNKIREDALARELDLPGYAKGGRVKAKQPHPCGCDTGYADGGFVQFDPTRVDSSVERLRAEFA